MKHLFYGTLRKGKENSPRDKTYNYERFGPGTQKYIKTLKLKGFKLVNLGHYPAAIESQNNEIICELHEVNEIAAKKIFEMEKGAGYLSKQVEIDGEKAVIYYCTPGDLNKQNDIIESGDWCG